jgi:hypothetical protein
LFVWNHVAFKYNQYSDQQSCSHLCFYYVCALECFSGGKKNLGNLPVAQAEEPVSPRRVVATSAWMMGMSTGQEFPPDGKWKTSYFCWNSFPESASTYNSYPKFTRNLCFISIETVNYCCLNLQSQTLSWTLDQVHVAGSHIFQICWR